ncbi:hypothetical protein C8R45DRAFT_1011886 [Mycena sanguinolenta]|nr:hypothetical protein C8R45DRAFT_1011886 [Mycena sanguinolenta]
MATGRFRGSGRENRGRAWVTELGAYFLRSFRFFVPWSRSFALFARRFCSASARSLLADGVAEANQQEDGCRPRLSHFSFLDAKCGRYAGEGLPRTRRAIPRFPIFLSFFGLPIFFRFLLFFAFRGARVRRVGTYVCAASFRRHATRTLCPATSRFFFLRWRRGRFSTYFVFGAASGRLCRVERAPISRFALAFLHSS